VRELERADVAAKRFTSEPDAEHEGEHEQAAHAGDDERRPRGIVSRRDDGAERDRDEERDPERGLCTLENQELPEERASPLRWRHRRIYCLGFPGAHDEVRGLTELEASPPLPARMTSILVIGHPERAD